MVNIKKYAFFLVQTHSILLDSPLIWTWRETVDSSSWKSFYLVMILKKIKWVIQSHFSEQKNKDYLRKN